MKSHVFLSNWFPPYYNGQKNRSFYVIKHVENMKGFTPKFIANCRRNGAFLRQFVVVIVTINVIQ